MNIFYLGYSLQESSGGIENYTFTILEYLQKQGHNIYVYTVNGQNKKFSNISFKKNKYIDRFFLGKRVASKLSTNNVTMDLYLCGHLYLAKHMEQIVKNTNSTYDLFVYGIDCWAGRFEQRLTKLKHLNKIISISSFTSEQIKKQGFKGEIVYVPPVLNTDKFPDLDIEKDSSRVNFITVGRLSSLEQYKGHDKVIEAVDILVNKFNIKNIQYRIVGKGDDKERLEDKVKSLNLNNYVKFYGFVLDSELPKVYAQSDVFIMPSNVSLDPAKPEGEGFGIVFTEAAMYELALIGPNSGGSTDIIDDGINGLECNPLSAEDIAEKMKTLVESEHLRNKFGKKAKEKVLKNFTLNQLDKYLDRVIK